MQWPFPSEDADPWYELWLGFVRAMDSSGFAAREDRNLIISGGGTITWNAGGPGLNWTAPFNIYSPSTGFLVQLQANTLNPVNGGVIRFDVVRHPGSNVSAAAEAALIAKNTDNSVVLAVRLGTSLYFRNGFIMTDGTSGSMEGLASGDFLLRDGTLPMTGNLDLADFSLNNVKGISFNELDNHGNVSGAVPIDWTTGHRRKVTLTGNTTFSFTNPTGVANLILEIVQDVIGGRTIVLPAAAKFQGGDSTLSAGANAIDLMTLFYDGTNYLVVINKGFV